MYLKATELKIGDKIFQHGGIFKVVEVLVRKAHSAPYEPVHANICEYLGLAEGATVCSIPTHWRDGWNCQGNANHVVKVLERAS